MRPAILSLPDGARPPAPQRNATCPPFATPSRGRARAAPGPSPHPIDHSSTPSRLLFGTGSGPFVRSVAGVRTFNRKESAMPVTLKKPAEQVDITSPEYDLLPGTPGELLWAHGLTAPAVFIVHGARERRGRGSAAPEGDRDDGGERPEPNRDEAALSNGSHRCLVRGVVLSTKGRCSPCSTRIRSSEVDSAGAEDQTSNVVAALGMQRGPTPASGSPSSRADPRPPHAGGRPGKRW